MKKILIATMFVLLLLMFGCAKTETVPEDTAPETAGTQVAVDVEEPASEPEGESMTAEGDEVLSDIACDRNARTLTFTITNTDSMDWYLERVPALEIVEKNPVKLTVTGKLVKTLDEICKQATLAPAESITCTIEYDENLFARTIRLTNGQELGTLNYNTLRLQTKTVSTQIEFDC
jgi:hypothetical protein